MFQVLKNKKKNSQHLKQIGRYSVTMTHCTVYNISYTLWNENKK